jgi:uncharacterized heparinase superfamily protein
MPALGTLWATLRPLRPAQLYYWPLRRFQREWPLRRAKSRPGLSRPAVEQYREWLLAVGPHGTQELLGRAERLRRGEFRFVGASHRLDPDHWSVPGASPLWEYHLHYFQWAEDLAWAFHTTGERGFLETLRQRLDSWERATFSRRGRPWAPYVVTCRSLAWLRCATLLDGKGEPELLSRLAEAAFDGLYGLETRLELDLQANHLQRNIHALSLGGLLFEGSVPEQWRRQWLPRLWDEFLDQVLPDGVHAERSPMYHAEALADLAEAVALAERCGERVPPEVHARGRLMCEVLAAVRRPDGTFHRFNDCADDGAPEAAFLERAAAQAFGPNTQHGQRLVRFPAGGFYGWIDQGAGMRLIIDAGAPGPPHQPGHSHSGCLSFELDLGHRSIIVDSGCSGYDGDPLREYLRSTRAHNTVQLGASEQSEVWGTFRVGRRARVPEASIRASDGMVVFEGECIPADGRGRHRRQIALREDGSAFRVEDQVSVTPDVGQVVSFIHLHPDVRFEAQSGGFALKSGSWKGLLRTHGTDSVRVVRGESSPSQGWFCPRFGVQEPGTVLELRVAAKRDIAFGYELVQVGKAS